jgi:hypothetical protein
MILKAGWNKKAGREPYGSEGTFCEIEIELDDALRKAENHDKLAEEIRHIQLLCKGAVEAELAIATRKAREAHEAAMQEAADRDADRRADLERERRETGRRDDPPPLREREGDYHGGRDRIDYREERRDGDRGRDERARERRDERPRERASRVHDRRHERRERATGSGNGQRDWKRDGGLPKTGKDLHGYCNDFDRGEDGTPTRDWFQAFAKRHNLPWKFSEWSGDEVADAFEQYEQQMEAAADHNGDR